jgi:hypothetical protein
MKLNDLADYYDVILLAENRQREYFEEIMIKKEPVAPQLFEDHENMIAYFRQYVMTQEFKALDTEIKDLIRKHIVERAKLPQIEEQMLAGSAGPSVAPAPAALPGMPPEGMSALPPAPPPTGPLPPVGLP